MRHAPCSPPPQLSLDFQKTPCRQALKQIPVGAMEIWTFRRKRRNWNSDLLNAYYVLLNFAYKGSHVNELGVHIDLGSNSGSVSFANCVVWARKHYSELVSSWVKWSS